MANNDLKIKIIGTLNVDRSIKEINAELKKVEKKIDKLKINVEISDKAAKSLNDLANQVKNLGSSSSSKSMQSVVANINNVTNSTQQATRKTIDLGNAFQQAFTKFPIWMISSTAFFLPLKAMDSMISRLIEIDSLMVDINRVMDIPDFKLTELLHEAVNASDDLSSRLTDMLKIIGEFGRMGFAENELLDISKSAQILQNISDLDAKSSVDTLTSAMLNFGIAAKDSLKIADSINEVDNSFAISSRDISDGIRRSASTAKTFGVELSNLIGYIAAIGSTTRETGAVIGNGKLFAA